MKSLFFTSLVTSTLLFASQSNTSDPLKIKEEGIGYIKMLGSALKKELQTQMKADKTALKAVKFCTDKASLITQEVNKKLPKYAKVRRTALKLRNHTQNYADAIDTKVMQEYVDAIKVNSFNPHQIKVVKEGNTTRVYKPLLTLPVCLKCHGTDIKGELKEHINKAYPEDKAVDFKVGSLRGAIVAEIQKESSL